ncbi:hypothetical protein L198_08083 [Cryptococcus wingfieldii CBS 7118]|uniref:BZIP domain-containing protein n=1 Tax=Cryptococcus wingfieldii CBS 7118 TaxID=1295528 RepID=A0A1E3HJ72_9TREE|nr:hypothetical protein L198_08083 [Cryptococcus wingfieldii CBS 7118]ODN76399.1 hypothetical protein L198_08083 [Cryptococcus wingfieldii CBS 7118]
MSSSQQSYQDTSSQHTDGAADSSASKPSRGAPSKQNRECARRFREGQATKARDLETKITELESKTHETHAENAELRSVIASLRSEIWSIQEEMEGEMVEDDEDDWRA